MIVPCDQNGINLALQKVRNGGVIVFPTDTVYGVGCDPFNKDAINRIYDLKGRDRTKYLPVLGYSKKIISEIAQFDQLSEKIADKFWPGPLTLVLKVKDRKIAESLNLKEKIAVRVPSHPCVLSLLKECKIMVGTSANHSGMTSLYDSKEVIKQFTGYDLLLDGGIISGKGESTIVEIIGTEFKVLRNGKIKSEDILS
ncbi:MAG: L-threonylcarbamoyladenylate synthase [Nitrososphaera sp.]